MRYQLAKQAQFVCRKLTVKEITEAEYETIRNEQQGAKYQTIHGTNSVHQVLSHSRMVVPSRTAAQKVNAPSGVVDMRLLLGIGPLCFYFCAIMLLSIMLSEITILERDYATYMLA